MWVYWKMVPPPDLDSSRKFSFSQGQRQYTYTVESMFVCRSDVSYDRSWVVVKRFNMNILTVKSQFSGHLSFIFLKSTSQVKPHFITYESIFCWHLYTASRQPVRLTCQRLLFWKSGTCFCHAYNLLDLMSTRARPWLVGTNLNTDFESKFLPTNTFLNWEQSPQILCRKLCSFNFQYEFNIMWIQCLIQCE